MNEENIIGFDALYESQRKCKKGVLWKDSVAHYHLNAIYETIKLSEQLYDKTYQSRPPKAFIITSPKRRDILSISFRDRVYQRSLNDNAIYPQMSKSFIRDNCACQKCKGTDYCRDRLDIFLHKYFRKYGRNGYVLQIDIKGYYPNMSHSVAEKTFQRRLSSEAYERTVDILRKQYGGEKGYNPGSQLVQIAGISVLDRLDHYVKEILRVKFYIRYMDDILLIHNDLRFLEECKSKIEIVLKDMVFELNQKKTRLYDLKEGIHFLGFTFKLTESGKVIRLLDAQNVKRQRKKLARMVALAKRGEITKADVDNSYKCWKSHAEKGNTWKLLKRMDEYYKSLWE